MCGHWFHSVINLSILKPEGRGLVLPGDSLRERLCMKNSEGSGFQLSDILAPELRL